MLLAEIKRKKVQVHLQMLYKDVGAGAGAGEGVSSPQSARMENDK